MITWTEHAAKKAKIPGAHVTLAYGPPRDRLTGAPLPDRLTVAVLVELAGAARPAEWDSAGIARLFGLVDVQTIAEETPHTAYLNVCGTRLLVTAP